MHLLYDVAMRIQCAVLRGKIGTIVFVYVHIGDGTACLRVGFGDLAAGQRALRVVRFLQIRFSRIAAVVIRRYAAIVGFHTDKPSLFIILANRVRFSALTEEIPRRCIADVHITAAADRCQLAECRARPNLAVLCIVSGDSVGRVALTEVHNALLDAFRRCNPRQQPPVVRRRTHIAQAVER